MTLQIGDRVEIRVPISDREMGGGTVRAIVDGTVDVEMDNSNWLSVYPEHLRQEAKMDRCPSDPGSMAT
jgi:hypothetical protein